MREKRGERERRKRPRHPGAGSKRGRPRPKGRTLDPAALEQVRALLGDEPRRRDLLLEFLHRLQDEYGCLSTPHLAALAHELRLAMAEVYEVASFYARFDIVRDGDGPPLTLRVCDSPTCELMGAGRLLEELRARAGDGLRVLRGPCMGRCDSAPVVEVGRSCVGHASADAVIEAAGRAGGADRADAGCASRVRRARGLSRCGRLRAAGSLSRGRARGGRADLGARWLGTARHGRRRLSGRAQVGAGSSGAEAAHARDQRGRGGARHLQGPLLPRARAAPLPRRHAGRGLGRGGGGLQHLSPRRVSRGSGDPAARDPAARGRGSAEARVRRASPRRRRLHLRRGVRHAREPRGKAWPAATPAAVSRRGGALRSPDVGPQRRDRVLGARHRREGRRLVRGPGPPR